MRQTIRGVVSLAMLCGLMMGRPAWAQAEWTAHGLRLSVDGAMVELAPATPSAFRISVNYGGTPGALPSHFLDPDRDMDVPWERVERDGFLGVQSAAGTLWIDPATGRWRMENSGGLEIVPPTEVICNRSKDAKTGELMINVAIGRREGGIKETYGEGSAKQRATLLSKGPEPANGVQKGFVRVPYFWSPDGYASLAVTADEKTWAQRPIGGSGPAVWVFSGDRADVYLIPAGDLKAAARGYARLSGVPAVPPRWTFGYLQSRWGWQDRAYIEKTLATFRERQHPVDAFIYDFEWYNNRHDYKIGPDGDPDFHDFGWNKDLFPEPSEQIASYKQQGVRFVGIRKPRVSNEKNLALAFEKGFTLHPRGWLATIPEERLYDPRSKERKAIRADLLMASKGFDFMKPEVREWYIGQMKPLYEAGIDGWWNDEGEFIENCFYYWNLAQSEAMKRFRPGERHWSVNRGWVPGVQRFGVAAWTGDIFPSWIYVEDTPATLLRWSLSGMPYGTCDIGGFWKPQEKLDLDSRFQTFEGHMPQMLTRWMQSGVFYPVMRTHSSLGATPHFPWNRGSEAEAAIRKALNLRYRLIPYYYSLAHYAHETGIPLMRAMVMEFPDDPNTADLCDQWMMGEGLMAAPVLTPDDRREVYFPDGQWHEFQSHEPMAGGRVQSVEVGFDEIPVYVRAGTILPLGPVLQHTGELPGGPLEVQVYPGKDATFRLIEDDGLSEAYKQGVVRRTTFTWDDAAKKLSWTVEGPYRGDDCFTEMTVVLFAPGGPQRRQADMRDAGHLNF